MPQGDDTDAADGAAGEEAAETTVGPKPTESGDEVIGENELRRLGYSFKCWMSGFFDSEELAPITLATHVQFACRIEEKDGRMTSGVSVQSLELLLDDKPFAARPGFVRPDVALKSWLVPRKDVDRLTVDFRGDIAGKTYHYRDHEFCVNTVEKGCI